MPPVLTYWGQFLDHELTARTDRESEITSIKNPHPPAASSTVESKFRNARSPRFDLDSVYGGSPVGTGITADMVTVISGLRHPTLVNKMRVGTAIEPGPLPDGLDEHRDLPRYVQVQASVRDAALRVAQASMTTGRLHKILGRTSAARPDRRHAQRRKPRCRAVSSELPPVPQQGDRFSGQSQNRLDRGFFLGPNAHAPALPMADRRRLPEGRLRSGRRGQGGSGPGLALLQVQGRVRCAAAELQTWQCAAARVLRCRLPVRAFHGSRVL